MPYLAVRVVDRGELEGVDSFEGLEEFEGDKVTNLVNLWHNL